MRLLKSLLSTVLLAMACSGQAQLSERQSRLLVVNCIQCHARGNAGFPILGNPEDWKTRNRQGEDRLLRSVIEGLRGMPPLGYCAACSEADLRALTRLVAGLEGGQ